jgi:hypothetical protein
MSATVVEEAWSTLRTAVETGREEGHYPILSYPPFFLSLLFFLSPFLLHPIQTIISTLRAAFHTVYSPDGTWQHTRELRELPLHSRPPIINHFICNLLLMAAVTIIPLSLPLSLCLPLTHSLPLSLHLPLYPHLTLSLCYLLSLPPSYKPCFAARNTLRQMQTTLYMMHNAIYNITFIIF